MITFLNEPEVIYLFILKSYSYDLLVISSKSNFLKESNLFAHKYYYCLHTVKWFEIF